jgi:PKD domain
MRTVRSYRRIALFCCTLAVASLGAAMAAHHPDSAHRAKPSATVLRSGDAAPRMLRVNNQSPSATIYASISNYTVDATVYTYDPDGQVVSMVIDFGDGATSAHSGAAATASHTYAAPGTYTITVTAVDNAGGYGVGTYTLWVSGGDTT